MCLGVSPQHANTVGRSLNLRTGYVSPQYHVVYDELFTTVHGHLTEPLFNQETWTSLLRLGGLENTVDPEDCHGDLVPFHEFFDDIVEGADTSGSEGDESVDPDPGDPPLQASEGASRVVGEPPPPRSPLEEPSIVESPSIQLPCTWILEIHRSS